LLKNCALMEVLGSVDETSSALGMTRALAKDRILKQALLGVQQHLYRLMSHLSAIPEARERYPGLATQDLEWLEDLIAEVGKGVPAVRDFVFPGDSIAGAACHIARSTARRAERRLVGLVELDPDIGVANLAYLNRLSSLMFVAALREDMLAGVNDSQRSRSKRGDSVK